MDLMLVHRSALILLGCGLSKRISFSIASRFRQLVDSTLVNAILRPELQCRKRFSPGLEMRETPSEITSLLQAWSEGDAAALDRLIPLVYTELHRTARQCMKRGRAGETLQTTAVIHEAYLRLVNAPGT